MVQKHRKFAGYGNHGAFSGILGRLIRSAHVIDELSARADHYLARADER